jgi:methionine synthase reductase
MSPVVHVIYGSQTGNSEDIAKELESELTDDSFPCSVECMSMNSLKTGKIDLKVVSALTIIVCSTTGNGDCPENGDAFWRSIKLKKTPKDHFEGLNYCVLGLGDTNYDKFCHMGKILDKRFRELGAIQALPLYCADEATGLEDIVEEWKVKVKECTKQVLAKGTGSSGEQSGDDAVVCSEAEGDKDPSDCKAEEASSESSLLLEDTLDFSATCSVLNLSVDLAAPPAISNLPRQPTVQTNVITLVSESDVMTNPAETIEESNEWSSENPYVADVRIAQWLTRNGSSSEQNRGGTTKGKGEYYWPGSNNELDENTSSSNGPGPASRASVAKPSKWGEERRVIWMEIALGTSGISYSPGDSIGIMCPNPPNLVKVVLDRLNIGLIAAGQTAITPETRLSGVGTLSPAKRLKAIDWLTDKIDLTSTPKKASVLALAQCCSDPNESIQMQNLVCKDKEGKALWKAFVEDQGLGIGLLLCMFKSCTPSLATLAMAVVPQHPRYYSIACSPLLCPTSVGVAFSCVQYEMPGVNGGHPIRRSGLCTSYLEKLLARWLVHKPNSGAQSAPDTTPCRVNIFHKPTVHFKLPGCAATPLILIGPGTGVAPFMGFLEHRSMLQGVRQARKSELCTGLWRGGFDMDGEDFKAEGSRVDTFIEQMAPGAVWLFFGCRDDASFLFKDRLKKYHKDGTLSELEVAQSRLSDEKIYVQHKIHERGEELAKLILNEAACVYICGDGNHMARDVTAAVVDVLSTHGNLEEGKAQEVIADMKTRRRWLMDIWS